VDGTIRILGERRRFVHDKQSSESARAYLRNYWKEVSELHGLDPTTLQDSVRFVLERSKAMSGWLLRPVKLALASAGNERWICPQCRKRHLHPAGGICTDTTCYKRLERESEQGPDADGT